MPQEPAFADRPAGRPGRPARLGSWGGARDYLTVTVRRKGRACPARPATALVQVALTGLTIGLRTSPRLGARCPGTPRAHRRGHLRRRPAGWPLALARPRRPEKGGGYRPGFLAGPRRGPLGRTARGRPAGWPHSQPQPSSSSGGWPAAPPQPEGPRAGPTTERRPAACAVMQAAGRSG